MPDPHLITLTDPRSAAAEAFRTLRTNLTYSTTGQPLTTIMMTSPAQADDKSTLLANLAVTFAQAGNRTILVDADLRKPTQHTIWGVSNDVGLSAMMRDDATIANPPLIQTSVPNLLLLPSGPLPPVPADVLGNQRLSDIIGVLKARAAYVLFDSPPVLVATDAALLGARVDGVLLAVRAGHTRRDHTVRARHALERVHARLLGAVLSNAPRESTGTYG
jgi:non-specific protein-tyrosine kinase